MSILAFGALAFGCGMSLMGAAWSFVGWLHKERTAGLGDGVWAWVFWIHAIVCGTVAISSYAKGVVA